MLIQCNLPRKSKQMQVRTKELLTTDYEFIIVTATIGYFLKLLFFNSADSSLDLRIIQLISLHFSASQLSKIVWGEWKWPIFL
jgi:hypothetical protein